jgi:hypothetical protein
MSDADSNERVLSKKNTLALEEAIKQLNVKMQEKEDKILGLQNTVASLTNRLDLLEQALMIQRVMAMGHGASVRS